MSCCSIKRAARKLKKEVKRTGKNIQGEIIDPVKKEASRIESKSRAELKRIPDNIDKAVQDVKGAVKDVFSEIFSIIPGSGAIKLIGIGIGAIILLSIIRRTRGLK